MKLRKINKKGISLSIVLLVFMALALIALTLFTFLSNRDKLEKAICQEYLLRQAYNEAEQIQFNINNGLGVEEAVDLFPDANLIGNNEVEIIKIYLGLKTHEEKVNVTYIFNLFIP